jgi:hypothetical protein
MAWKAIPALFPFEGDDILIKEFSDQLLALLVGAIVQRVIPVCLFEVNQI